MKWNKMLWISKSLSSCHRQEQRTLPGYILYICTKPMVLRFVHTCTVYCTPPFYACSARFLLCSRRRLRSAGFISVCEQHCCRRPRAYVYVPHVLCVSFEMARFYRVLRRSASAVDDCTMCIYVHRVYRWLSVCLSVCWLAVTMRSLMDAVTPVRACAETDNKWFCKTFTTVL